MSDQFGSSSSPKTLNCPTCGYLMEVKYLGDLKDKKAVCPACNTKVDLDDSFARTHKRITRKKGLFGSEEIEEIISEERSDFKPTQPPVQPQAPQTPPNVFGQYTTPPAQPYAQPHRPPVQQPQVFVSGKTYTYSPGKAKSKSGGGGLGCVIFLIVIASVVVPIFLAVKNTSDSLNGLFSSSNPNATEIQQTADFMIRSSGRVPTAAPNGDASKGGAVALASWKILNGHTSDIYQVAYSPDGLHVASTSSDDTLRLWDISTGKTIATITGTTFEEPRFVAFTPDGQYMLVASDSDGKIKFYSPQDGSLQFQIDTGEHNITSFAVSPDSSKLAVADYQSIYMYDIESRSRLTQTPTSTGTDVPYFQQITFSTDGNLVFGSTYDGIYVWDLTSKTLELLLSSEASSYDDFAVMPGGSELVIAGSGSEGVQIIDLSNGRIVKSMPGGLGGGAKAVAISPDGKYLATGSFFGDFYVYNLATNTVVYTTSDDLDSVESLAFSPNGHVVLVGTSGDEVRLFLLDDNLDPFEGVSVFDPNKGDVVGFASPTPAPVVGCVISSRNQVNLRNGPGTDYTQRGALQPGVSRQADGKTTGSDGKTWWRLVDGTWVRSDVVDEEGNCDALPVVTP